MKIGEIIKKTEIVDEQNTRLKSAVVSFLGFTHISNYNMVTNKYHGILLDTQNEHY